MSRADLMKRHFSDTLMEMSKTKRLSEITISDLIQEAGTAKQTFYNHFEDLDDLICYTATRRVYTGKLPAFSKEFLLKTYEYSLAHKDFFKQLPYHTGYNSFRESTVRWLKEYSYSLFINNTMSEAEKLYRKLRIDLYAVGQMDIVIAWFASNMEAPPEILLEAIWDSAPSFMKDMSV